MGMCVESGSKMETPFFIASAALIYYTISKKENDRNRSSEKQSLAINFPILPSNFLFFPPFNLLRQKQGSAKYLISHFYFRQLNYVFKNRYSYENVFWRCRKNANDNLSILEAS